MLRDVRHARRCQGLIGSADAELQGGREGARDLSPERVDLVDGRQVDAAVKVGRPWSAHIVAVIHADRTVAPPVLIAQAGRRRLPAASWIDHCVVSPIERLLDHADRSLPQLRWIAAGWAPC